MTAVIDFMFSRHILILRQLASALDMPYMAAKRYVDKLVETGVLKETIRYVHQRVFMAHEIFGALEIQNRPEGIWISILKIVVCRSITYAGVVAATIWTTNFSDTGIHLAFQLE